MSGPGPGGGGPDSPRPSRRRGTPNSDGLAALGDLIDGKDGAAGGSTGADGGTGGGRRAPAVANEAGLAALGEKIKRQDRPRRGRHGRPKAKRRHRARRGILIGLSVLLVLLAAGAGYTYYVTHDLHREEVRGLHGALTTGQEASTENILMVGSTSRCALTKQNAAYGLCDQGVNGVNSDVMMILHVDPTHHRLALLSIPRDLFIPNARSTGANKVDAGLYEGLTQLVAAIEQDFAIPIQHAVSLNFDQFANVVDALNGVNMAFPESVYDLESGLNVQAAACVHLDGTQALQVVRARHLQYQGTSTSPYANTWTQENQSDLARIRRNHEFLRVLGSAVAQQGLGNPLTDLSLINSVKADLTFDQSWSVNDMANLVFDFHSVNVNSVPQLTLPVSVVTDPSGAGGGLMYEGANYGDVEFPSESGDQATVQQVLGIGPHIDSMTGEPLPAPSSVTVSVMNGTGASNQATDTASALGALGFQTVGTGDTTPTGDISETVVYYGSTSPAVEAAAETVARSITGAVILGYNPAKVADGAQVTVVTGTQFTVDTPAPPPTSSTATTAAADGTTAPAAPASTSTPTTSAASANIAAPSAASTDLQPWDPRACAPGAPVTAPVVNRI